VTAMSAFNFSFPSLPALSRQSIIFIKGNSSEEGWMRESSPRMTQKRSNAGAADER